MRIDTTLLTQKLREEKMRLCTMIEGATSASSRDQPPQTYLVGSVALTEQQGLQSPAPFGSLADAKTSVTIFGTLTEKMVEFGRGAQKGAAYVNSGGLSATRAKSLVLG